MASLSGYSAPQWSANTGTFAKEIGNLQVKTAAIALRRAPRLCCAACTDRPGTNAHCAARGRARIAAM
jgi:hypothetical protein